MRRNHPAKHILLLVPIIAVVVVAGFAKQHAMPPKYSGHPARTQEIQRAPRPSLDDLYTSPNVPVDIPDGPGGIATSTLTIPDNVTITDLNVMVSITHTWIRDLRISLIGPGDTLEVVMLELLPQDNAVNMTETWFDDGAAVLIDDGTPPFTGYFRPQHPLGVFEALNALGTWTLRVEDELRVDTGRIEAWAIDVNPLLSMEGLVTDSVTENGVPDVLVTLFPVDTVAVPDTAISYTSINGHYGFLNLPPGFYTAQFTKELYDTVTVTGVEIVAGVTTVLDVIISSPFGFYEFSSASAPVAIADQDTAEMTLQIDDDLLISDLDITVNVNHTYAGDIDLFLISPPPAPQIVQLYFADGATDGDNFINTRFDDEATTPVEQGTPPYTGSFRPYDPLTEFDSISTLGLWTLRAVDNFPEDIGEIQNFTLHISTGFLAAEDPFIPHPSSFILSVYPNPFNASTEFRFDLHRAGQIELKLYDLLGREVATLLDAWRATGTHAIPFDATGLASGVYIAQFSAFGHSEAKKVLLLK